MKTFVKREQFAIIGEINFVKQEATAGTGVEATTVVNYSKEQVRNYIIIMFVMTTNDDDDDANCDGDDVVKGLKAA